MRRVTNTNLLFWINLPVLTEHFLQANVPLSHLLNAKPPFISWWRPAFNEVNDSALNDFWWRGKSCFGASSFQKFFDEFRPNFWSFFSIAKAAISHFHFGFSKIGNCTSRGIFHFIYYTPFLPPYFWKKTGIEIAHWGDQTWSLTFSIIVLCKNVCVYAITSDIYYIKVIGHQKQTSYRDRWQYFWHHSVIKHSGLKS